MKHILDYTAVWDAELAALLEEALLKTATARSRASIYSPERCQQLDDLCDELGLLVDELRADAPLLPPTLQTLPSVN